MECFANGLSSRNVLLLRSRVQRSRRTGGAFSRLGRV